MKSLVKKDAVYEISVNLQGKENDNEDCSTEDNLEEAPATFDDKDIDSTDELAGDLMDMILWFNDCKYSLDDIDDCKGRAEDSDDNDYPETITLQEESVVASDDDVDIANDDMDGSTGTPEEDSGAAVFKIYFLSKIILTQNCFQPKSFSFFVVDKIYISQLKLNMYMKLKQTVTIHFENGWIYCNA